MEPLNYRPNSLLPNDITFLEKFMFKLIVLTKTLGACKSFWHSKSWYNIEKLEHYAWHVMGYWPPSKNIPPQIGNPPVLKMLTPLPQSSNFLLPPLTGNKKHEDVKLMHKPLIQHNSWQIKKQSETWRNTINLIQTLTFRLNINERFKYEKFSTPPPQAGGGCIPYYGIRRI